MGLTTAGAVAVKQIGQRIKEARKAANLTQADVASEVGVSRQAISAWERGSSIPSVLEMRLLGLALGASLDYLVCGVKTIPAAGELGRTIFADPAKSPLPQD
jgi:transcriptional regulator with XRE-family HTH domain